MVRFFVDRKNIYGTQIALSAEDAEHIRSLRLRPGEQFIVCNGAGLDYVCRLSDTSGTPTPTAGSVAEIVETHPSRGEPDIECNVYIAYAKGDRLDYAVQKSVELGARSITLFPSRRCVSAPGDATKKVARLQRVSKETAKQCGRGIIPDVTAANSFEDAVTLAARADFPLFLYEGENELHLKQALEQAPELRPDSASVSIVTKSAGGTERPELRPVGATVSIVTGPEGGFDPPEAEYASKAGMLTVTLGPRILRCETAPAAALAAVMYHSGNL